MTYERAGLIIPRNPPGDFAPSEGDALVLEACDATRQRSMKSGCLSCFVLSRTTTRLPRKTKCFPLAAPAE